MSDKQETFQVTINERREVILNQTLHIIRFDEESVTLMTQGGKVLIEGKELKVESLSKESGLILIVGEILNITFSKQTPKSSHILGGKRA